VNQDLRSEHIVRLISGAKRRLMAAPPRDDGRRRRHDRRERVGVVGDEVPDATWRASGEHGDSVGRRVELARAD
jgi:hypothetical protein